MSITVLVAGEELDGAITEVTYELTAMARALSGDGGTVVVCGAGEAFRRDGAGIAADRVCVFDGVDGYTPDGHAAAVAQCARDTGASVLLASTSAMGLDTAAAVAAAVQLPLVSYATAAQWEGDALVVTSQLYGGKLSAECEVASGRAAITVIPGSTASDAGRGTAGSVDTVSASGAAPRITFKRLLRPESTGVDITREDLLVSVGRGIESQDNIEMVEELAGALGATISASRPIIDSGWLPKARQVGKSGLTVKPKLYLAVGISGAPEHIQGMKDAELIVAVNSDAGAPIFDHAHFGICGDLFEVIPALTECAKASA